MNLENLNPQQLQAVQHDEGPLMVVAGAGSGKTRVITCRIANLIQEKQASPESILAITFTNKAAGEMKERVRNMLDFRGASPWISTFHSFCLRILRKHISELGFSNDFAVYDAQDQLTLVKQCMKVKEISADAFPPKTLLNHISSFKNDFLMPEDVKQEEIPYGHQHKAAGLYPVYQAALKKNNALDFDDLLVFAGRLFQEVPNLQRHYSEKFKYIMVDEFQDTNAAQYKLVRLLSETHKNICVVGDDDQSIYRWRGANIENILKFENDYPGTTVIKLEENYRSTQNILNAAGSVVKENKNRKDKTLWTQNEKGSPVLCYKAEDETEEARFVCEKIQELNREEGFSFNEMAVLYRTNAQSRVMEDMLRRTGLPYQVIGGLRFYERKEIKDVLAYMRVVLNPSDSVSLKRIINVPARGIGKTSLEKIEAYCQQKGLSLLEGLRDNGQAKLAAPAASKKIVQFLQIIDELSVTFQHGNPLDLLREVVDKSGYGGMLEADNTHESKGRIENLQELFSAVEQSLEDGDGSLQEFLDSATLVADLDNLDDERGVLPLMTLHTCKGLEFSSVFLVGMENGLLPHASSMSDPEEYEEERRLCYVGFTRARKNLFVSHARQRRIYGSTFNYLPSDFLLSIPSEIMTREPDMSRYESVSAPAHGGGGMPSSQKPDGAFTIGTKVLHAKFGSGIVINRSGDEEDLKLEVFFKAPHGKKKLAANLAKLIVI
ncbi:MAG: UvrD-helicase domain-containing protein [Nitrospinaceae bacterium]|nr:UvrD-helicase domain-containing protein [Nitrospina sp.]MBT5376442.1 UvrD-helicase domain-containing protein [Nitrospinaceae bacterium]MBT5868405.1 UvrD-helicase domain-containing protein [Nitrospinaceae bacterium]MBT6346159.1 UvrD-helicase domain-containing protein [Nitrospina sp.]